MKRLTDIILERYRKINSETITLIGLHGSKSKEVAVSMARLKKCGEDLTLAERLEKTYPIPK